MEDQGHADIKIHPPILLLIHIFAALVLNRIFPLPLPFAYIFPISGGLFALIGLMLAFAAVRELAMANTTIDPHGSVSTVVMTGPYRFTRNPIYLGFLCMLIGFPMLFGTFWGIILEVISKTVS
jgi:protein-S-isoprenylcysteine O-methyltransferase Ste14